MPSLEIGVIPPPLTGSNRDSFAFPTLKDRVPVIICKVIDLLHRRRFTLEPAEDLNAIKPVIEDMAKLRYELQTNKPLSYITDKAEDEEVWNTYLDIMTKKEGQVPQWFNTTWLYAECYAYRRLIQAIRLSPSLANFDMFRLQKEDAFFDSLSAIRVLAKRQDDLITTKSNSGKEDTKKIFSSLLQLSLWGNKCDLSISAGASQTFSSEPLEQISHLRDHLLVDDTELVWEVISQVSSEKKLVDIVMDNAGFELFVDLCLADFLLQSHLATKVRLRVKVNPWFVSDTTTKDVEWLLEKLKDGAVNPVAGDGKKDSLQSHENDADLEKLGSRWSDHISSGKWEIVQDSFWTYPHGFSEMRSVSPNLYEALSDCDLIIFKGDLNYRKLVGDLSWKPTDSFSVALQGFQPAPLVALRTLKADVITGLSEGQDEKIFAQDPNWMVNGEYGVIQLSKSKV